MKRKVMTAEKVVADMMSMFVKFQQESEEWMSKYEEWRALDERALDE